MGEKITIKKKHRERHGERNYTEFLGLMSKILDINLHMFYFYELLMSGALKSPAFKFFLLRYLKVDVI